MVKEAWKDLGCGEGLSFYSNEKEKENQTKKQHGKQICKQKQSQKQCHLMNSILTNKYNGRRLGLDEGK
jgi:hypothetical protein